MIYKFIFAYKKKMMFLALPICFGKSCFKHNTKVQKIRDETFYNHGFYYDLQLNISIFSPCWYA